MNLKIFSYRILLFLLLPLCGALLISCSCECGNEKEANIPAEVLNNANQFIISKTGKEFFEKYISPDFQKSRQVSSNYFMVYRFTIPNKSYIDETISFTVDGSGAAIKDQEIAGIPNCTSSPEECEYLIDEDKAVNIAEDAGLDKGIKEWKTGFLWNAKHQQYVWHILSTIWESDGEYMLKGRGKEIIIDPNSGEVLEMNNWHIR